MTTKRVDIEQAIEVLSEVFGNRENLLITILEILRDDGDITEAQRVEILQAILAHEQQNQQQEEEQQVISHLRTD